MRVCLRAEEKKKDIYEHLFGNFLVVFSSDDEEYIQCFYRSRNFVMERKLQVLKHYV